MSLDAIKISNEAKEAAVKLQSIQFNDSLSAGQFNPKRSVEGRK